MQREQPFTMMPPSPGFTSRVMARIEERERGQARRRALIGAGLLIVAGATPIALFIVWVASWIDALLAGLGTLVAMLLTVSPLAGSLLEALFVAATAILRSADTVQMLVYALAVLALTMVWARVATGPSLHPLQISVGGQRK